MKIGWEKYRTVLKCTQTRARVEKRSVLGWNKSYGFPRAPSASVDRITGLLRDWTQIFETPKHSCGHRGLRATLVQTLFPVRFLVWTRIRLTRHAHNLISKITKHCTLQWLAVKIRRLVPCGAPNNLHSALGYCIGNKKITHVNVLHPLTNRSLAVLF